MATMSPAKPSSIGVALQAAEGQYLGDAAFLDQVAVAIENLDRLIGLHSAGKDTPGDDAAKIRIGLQDRAQHAERAVLDLGRRDVADDEIEQRRHALVLGPFGAGRHPALLGRAIQNREIELLFGRVQRREQVEHLVSDFGRTGVGAIDLVDDDDGIQPHLERLDDDEFGLRQRPFGGIDQHQRAVHHVEDALDLAAEIGVAGGVDDVDAGVLPDQRSGLGQDGDAPFALQVVGIQRPLGHPLVLAERAGLLQQAVDQGGLAVVDVGDNGDIAKIHWACNSWGLWGRVLGLKTKTSPEGPAVQARYIVTFRPEAIGEVHQDVKRMKLDEAPGVRVIFPMPVGCFMRCSLPISSERRVLCVFPAYTPRSVRLPMLIA